MNEFWMQSVFLDVYCNQAAASKSVVAGASRQAKLAVDIMLRVIILDWPEKSEQLDVTKCISRFPREYSFDHLLRNLSALKNT